MSAIVVPGDVFSAGMDSYRAPCLSQTQALVQGSDSRDINLRLHNVNDKRRRANRDAAPPVEVPSRDRPFMAAS